ncbi:winged helix DNA-binding domain-containing protein [Vibrio sp. Of7-15]|uniref:winged helix-turn-helix domain-containing protein n=1 Tax=Vibrio sp. Of7-15 TaxID=2724879 RepID=UPI001EF1EC0A|nr:crosslink repair DNA glycosylase YcaQ family protein [Vibrio sp. Of7-15]MCG7498079.1 winged helix DNA-binding domain-containing protein [Vibrio sp. Of7-15]
MESLSLSQARKLALLSQGLLGKPSEGCAYSKSLEVIERLGYVQIDTIAVVQRAHHHTLWSRNPSYNEAHLQKMVAEKKVFEYWSHAAAYLPMRDFRFTLPRKMAIKSGKQNHWYQKDHQLMRDVLARIEDEGPLMAKDFTGENRTSQGWGSKPTKRALETLYMQGDLMISERRNFHKVYDLTERVLPNDVDLSLPTEQEYGQFLVRSYLRAHGFGSLTEMNYLLKGVKNLLKHALNDLCDSGEIEKVTVNKTEYYASNNVLTLLNQGLNEKQVKFLSPFDNLLIQRKRASTIFQFDYLLECYVPGPKRQFGYFCLPILWGDNLVARADCKVDKRTSTLHVIHLYMEPTLDKQDNFLEAFEEELSVFAQFNQCNHHKIEKVSRC